MSTKQAIAEARRRWGKPARIERRFVTPYTIKKGPLAGEQRCTCHRNGCASYHWECSVGAIALGMFFEVKGSGETFAAAFAAVDTAEAADRERYRKIREERAKSEVAR